MAYYDYSLAGVPIRVACDEPLPLAGDLDAFCRQDNADPAAVYRAKWYDGELSVEGTPVFCYFGYTIYRTDEGYTYRYRVGNTDNPHDIVLRAAPARGEYRLFLPTAHRALIEKSGIPLANSLGHELLFAANRRLMIHSSLIAWQGGGLIFTGPSGMGKSTQAGLWQAHMGAQVLNGDKSIVHVQETVVAWGSPWAGTSGIYRNECAPLRGIVALRQAAENRIEQLHGREALAELMPRMGTVPWGGDWHLQVMDCVIDMLTRVPVYRLHCRPNAEAVALVRDTIFD